MWNTLSPPRPAPKLHPNPTDRRASVRHAARLRASCRIVGKGRCLEASVRDLSAHGVGLLLPEPLPRGTLLQIELRRLDGTPSPVPHLLARITYIGAQAAEGWAADCALIAELLPEELALFQAEAVRAAVIDSRRWVRFTCDVEITCSTEALPAGDRCRARVLEISAGGIGLHLGRQVPPGTLLRLRLPATHGEDGQTLLVRVVHYLRYGEGGWFLGCEFVRQLTDGEMQALLG